MLHDFAVGIPGHQDRAGSVRPEDDAVRPQVAEIESMPADEDDAPPGGKKRFGVVYAR
jgi:hypothetical protein